MKVVHIKPHQFLISLLSDSIAQVQVFGGVAGPQQMLVTTFGFSIASLLRAVLPTVLADQPGLRYAQVETGSK